MNESGDNKTYGEPDEWEFDYPWEIIQTAFWLWAMSGFQYLPRQDEVMAYDPRFISDIRLAHMIYSHQGNKSAPMRMLEQWEAFNKNPQAYEAQQQMQQTIQNTDSANPQALFNRQKGGTGRALGIGNFLKRPE